jgi:hypothetical protein
MNKMKKNILQLSIVFIAVLLLSTTTMAGGKKHPHEWWNPFSSLWSAIEQLQDDLGNLNQQVEDKLAALAQDGGTTPTSFPSVDLSTGPIVCPGCLFPEGRIFSDASIDTTNLLKGAFLPGVEMYGTNLSGVDLSKIDLRGAQLFDINFSGATLIGADFSPRPVISNGNPYETKTKITNGDLTGADLTDATGLDTVIWTNTICPDGKISNTVGNTCKDNL